MASYSECLQEFDEYEYLEKTVEGSENQSKKIEKSYRKRDGDDVNDDERRRRKYQRIEGENDGERRRRDEREREKEKERERRREKEERERRLRRSSSRHDDRDRDRGKSKERELGRSSSRSRRHNSKERESRRSPSRSRRHDSRERVLREAEIRDRESRRYKEKKESVEPEADLERDQRTVFAYQMSVKVTERDVYEFFSKAGRVRDVRLIMDRNSRRSKGVGYIEFYDVMSVPMAIAMSGQLLLDQPVMVKPSEAEKNLVQSTATGSSVAGPTDRKLYVGNLHFNMTEQQLHQIFEPFGPVELVQLPVDLETGHCKGFGFVQFTQAEHAKQALILNGKLEIAGRYIKISSVTEHIGAQEAGTTAADFDDDDGGGLALNARSRAMLMAKLDRTGTASSIAGSLGVPLNGTALSQQPFSTIPAQVLPPVVSEPIGTPTECLLLKNLFDPATETDPEFDLDLKDDVEEECAKYGRVRHIYVDKHSAGHVYLRYHNIESAMKAQKALHMRWFARRLISAIFMKPQDYKAKFVDGC